MPRIDPLQLLNCLSVLLSPEGGILCREEVPRLVNLMTKFSKKLVSKCVYVLILKNTETELVDMFMAEGGWTLIQTWLQDAVQTGNWDLVREILGLLLITPVDVERLKLNILPKLIKSLSRREELEGVAKLSTQLVQQWLAIVKGSSATAGAQQQQTQPPKPSQVKAEIEPAVQQPETTEEKTGEDKENVEEATSQEADNYETISTGAFYKPLVREGKLVVCKLPTDYDAAKEEVTTEVSAETRIEEAGKDDEESEEKKLEEKEKSKSSSRSSKSSSKSSRDRDKDKDKDRDRKKSSSGSSKSSSSSKSKSSSSSSRDKEKRDKEKDRHKSSSKSSKSSSSKERRDSKEKDKDKTSEKEKHPEKDKEKQAEKDKDTLAKIKPQSLDKLGRIPKKSVEEKPKDNKDTKKKSFSVGIRKDSEERPKTVKVFNSKMRSTGLEEEIKPAPPRPVKKPTPSVQLPTIPTKRPSPPREHRDPILPPEKKIKIDKVDIPERPGAIKLIPPKPKPTVLQESDLFMDALTASATAKKEPKKRKRRLSVTKEPSSSPASSPAREQPQTPTSPTTTTGGTSLGLKNIAPINFYQDTLKTEENAENSENPDNENKENAVENNVEVKEDASEENKETPSSPMTPTDDTNGEEIVEVKKPKLEGGLKGVLLYAKKKGPKRSISWKTESDLVEIRYFELDETERVNVTKTFGDMAKMEMTSEREALQLSRKVVGEDTMEAQIPWRLPYLIDQADPLAAPGHKSLEKDIQFAREKSVLQALYFDKRRVPDSPEEPIPENHQMSDPILIPLEDPETQEIDLRNTPWPEPKGSPPHVEPQVPPHIFNAVPGPFNPFNNMPPPGAFPGMPPRFPGPGGNPGGPMGPGNFIPPNMIPNGNMMGPPNMGPPGDMMNQGPMNQNMFPPAPVHDGFGPGPEFPMFNQPNANMNMFPPNNFNNHRPGNRGGFRRGGGNGGNWVRMSGPGNWKRGGGGGHRGGRLCKNVQNHGYCRNRDNCPFVHP